MFLQYLKDMFVEKSVTCFYQLHPVHFITETLLTEVSGILELGNVWVFVQLLFGPHWPMNQLNKNPNIAQLQDS